MKKAFTLIEIMLVMGLILTMGFLGTSFSLRFVAQSATNDSALQFRGAFAKARTYAAAGKSNSAWGVRYSDSAITLFAGDSYGARDVAHDEVTRINSHVSVSGFDEIVFQRPDGRPNQAVPDLELKWDDLQTENLSINSEGAVQ